MKIARLVFLYGVLGVLLSSLAWAKAPTRFKVFIEDNDNYPFEFVNRDKLSGLHIEVIEEVTKTLNWTPEWTAMPWPRARATLESGSVDAISYFVTLPGKKEPALVLLKQNILHEATAGLFIRKDQLKDITYKGGSLDPLKKYSIGIVQGDVIDDYMTLVYPKLHVDRTARSYEQLFKMLTQKRFDVVIAATYGLIRAGQKIPDISKTVTLIKPYIASSSVYLAFPNTPAGSKKAHEFGNAFEKFKSTDKYAHLLEKYKYQD